MIMFGDSTKELLKVSEKCLDSQLWHACAGGVVQMPKVNSSIYYFPQGQAEHSITNVDFGNTPIPPYVLCRVNSIKFLADPETDEVFSKMHLQPIKGNEPEYGVTDEPLTLSSKSPEIPEKPNSFAKTLTQSDANNGGGFSVPRYCAETIFPRLDYSADPPVQNILAKDVHGEVWKFRHIYRGTPRRHLLTTGWSTFVNQKKLVAGDSIVFLRTENRELCVGIRRAKRGMGVGPESISGWNPPPNGNYGNNTYGGFSMFLREEESKLLRSNGYGGVINTGGGFANMRGKGGVKAESVVEAATLAARGQGFEVVYYPRSSTPEFCVKASAVRTAMRIQWCPGMRFKMPFETEDSSRISWFMGTISAVQPADPIRWPNSPWRLLEVTWDEPDFLQNVTRVSPWLVELVSNIPSIHLTPFSPPRKKLRIPHHPDFPENQLPTPVIFPETHFPLRPCSSPAGIQGARHNNTQFGSLSLPNLHLNKLHSGIYPTSFHPNPPPLRIPTGLFISKPTIHNNISCLLTIGTPSQNSKKSDNGKAPLFVLFGQPILTEEQISQSSSGNSSSDKNTEKVANFSDGSGENTIHQSSSVDIPWYRNSHCKVFMESEDVGRTLDLSFLHTYEELYEKLADMFGMEKSELISHVVYCDASGGVMHIGDEQFSEFVKTAHRLIVFMDSGSNNIRG